MDNCYWLGQIQPSDRKWVGETAFQLNQLVQQDSPVLPGFVIGAKVWHDFWQTHNWLEPFIAEMPYSSLHLNIGDSFQLSQLAKHIRHEIIQAQLPPALNSVLEQLTQNLQASSVILRPSLNLPINVINHEQISQLWETQICLANLEEMATSLKQIWAELFRARSLFVWQHFKIELHQINLAVIVQPLWPTTASGEVCVKSNRLEIQATWGLHQTIERAEVIPDYYQFDLQTQQLQQQRLGSKSIAYYFAGNDHNSLVCCGLNDRQMIVAERLNEKQQNQYTLEASELNHLTQLAQQASTQLGSACLLKWTLVIKPQDPPTFYLTQAILLPNSPKSLLNSSESVSSSQSMISKGVQTLSAQQLLARGLPASGGQATGLAWIVDNEQHFSQMPANRILIAPSLLPEWLPWIKQAAGIITEQGGMTSHGAILARELGIPAVVGVSGITQQVQPEDSLLIEGNTGTIYRQTSPLQKEKEPSPQILSPSMPMSHFFRATQLFVNLTQPSSIERVLNFPVDGVGLIRSELMLIECLENRSLQQWLQAGKSEQLIEKISSRLGQFVKAFWPRPVFYRSLDLETNSLLNFTDSQSVETNPKLGVRGTFSYLLDSSLFDLELQALLTLQQAGYTNLNLILPFIRSVEEFEFCRDRVERAGLTQQSSFQLWIMAEVPSVLFLLPEYIKAGVQGIAIGSNDLTQLLMAADRDNPQFAHTFNEQHPAVLRAIQQLIESANKIKIPCTFCGGSPQGYLALVEQLILWGITSISVEVGAIEMAHNAIIRAEQRLLLEAAKLQLSQANKI